jgi:hypothetical protein
MDNNIISKETLLKKKLLEFYKNKENRRNYNKRF